MSRHDRGRIVLFFTGVERAINLVSFATRFTRELHGREEKERAVVDDEQREDQRQRASDNVIRGEERERERERESSHVSIRHYLRSIEQTATALPLVSRLHAHRPRVNASARTCPFYYPPLLKNMNKRREERSPARSTFLNAVYKYSIPG